MTFHSESDQAFLDAIAHNLDGIVGTNAGVCPDLCETCEQTAWPVDGDHLLDEGGFSSRPCDSCGSGLAGDRFNAHGFLDGDTEQLIHLDICVDCLMLHANGVTPGESDQVWQA